MNLKHVFRHLAIIGWVGTAGYAVAQDVTGLYKVDLSTGTANIQVPISGYTLGGNEFGASLSYNTKGVPVKEFAGIAGSHWHLNTGGSITRVIKGLPDEWYSAAPSVPGTGPESIFFNTYNEYRGRLIEGMESPAQKSNQKVYRDPESDEYYFNVGNLSFQFFLGRDGAIYCNTKQKFEVTILTEDGLLYRDQPLPALPAQFIEAMPQRSFTFRVKDPQSGFSYYFSRSASSFTHVMAFFRGKFSTVFNEGCSPLDDPLGIFGGRTRVTNSWKLDSVVSAANEKISYIYERFIYPPNYNIDTTAYHVLENYVHSGFAGRDDTVKTGSIDPFWRAPDSIDLVREIIYPYKGARLIFNYEKTTPRLEFWSKTNGGSPVFNGIYYFSRLNTIEYAEQGWNRVYKFDYTYFHTPNGNYYQTESDAHLGDADDMYSLKLKSLSVRDRWTGNFQLLYRFGYNDNKARRFAKGLDYHGYFKGDVNNIARPGHSLYGKENREPDLTYMQYGILNSIISGTGGKVSFAYGIHKLSDLTNAMTNSPNWVGNTLITPPGQPGYVVGDGLKIDRVTIEDINDTETRTFVDYTYEEGQYFLPGGIYTLPTYFNSSNDNIVQGKHIYESFMNPGYFHNGCNHAYSKVTEKHSNSYGQQLSLKEYQLSNFTDALSNKNLVVGGGQASVDFPFTRKQYMRTWEMGLPLNIKTYDDKDLIVEEHRYSYQFVTDTLSSLLAKVNDTNRVVSNVVNGPVLFHYGAGMPCADIRSYKLSLDPYRPYKGLSLLKQLETRNYTSNTEYTADISTYDYDARNNVKSVRNRNSKGEYTESYSVYNYDIPATGDPALLKMQQEGSEYLVATERWNNGTANPGIRNTGSRLLNGSVFKYKLENGGIYNEKVMETALEAPLAYSSYMSGGSGDVSGAVMAAYNGSALPAHVKLRTEVQLRDSRGNPLETYLPTSDVYKSMIWDTLSGHKLADVMNARYSNIAYSGFEYGYGHKLQASAAFILYIDDNGTLSLPPGFTESVPVSSTLSGNYFCLLKSGTSAAKRLYTEGLEPGIRYRATFWASANAVPEFGIEGGTQFSLKQIAVKGQYKQYEVFFTPTAAGQKIGLNAPAANVAIDELRIHPENAQMNTYTYQKLNGKSSETDALGRITFYEYDGLGRLHLVRDQEGHILQKKTYGIPVKP
ncbi:MAG: hypothetical protein JNM21_09000 [Taibaiella sp.]|nr:hypothetical protein [Taibaiella sp.]